jgi:hypothetical protein
MPEFSPASNADDLLAPAKSHTSHCTSGQKAGECDGICFKKPGRGLFGVYGVATFVDFPSVLRITKMATKLTGKQIHQGTPKPTGSVQRRIAQSADVNAYGSCVRT